MPVFRPDQYERFWRSEIEKIHPDGPGKLRGACPVHGGDSDHTLSIDLASGMAHCFKCHAAGGGWSMIDFAMERYGFGRSSASDYVRGQLGELKSSAVRPWSFPFPKPLSITTSDWQLGCLARSIAFFIDKFDSEADKDGNKDPGWQCTALYPYEPMQGMKLRYQHPRKPKRMVWLTLTERGGWSRPSKSGRQAGLYRAASLTNAAEVWLLNGEKAVDRAVKEWGITATCLPNGEGNWKDEYLPALQTAGLVYIVCDNDDTGSEHGQLVGAALARAGIETRIATLPGVEAKADLWDFMEAGGTIEEARIALEEGARGDPDYVPAAPANGRPPAAPPPEPPPEVLRESEGPDLVPYECHDTGNAQRLIAFSGDDIRYCHATRSWYLWNGAFWESDARDRIFDLARRAMRRLEAQASARADDKLYKFAYRSLNQGPLNAMVALAQSMAPLSLDDLDTHRLLLPCLNGVFDVATGEFREHRKEDFITRLMPVRYDPQAGDPVLYLRTLDELMGGGPDASEGALADAEEKLAYLERIFGYILTGEICEKAFFCFWGESGNNGKTLTLGILFDILGPYAVRIDPLTLTRSQRQGDSNRKSDMAAMKGTRLALASEPPEGEKFDQATLKMLSAGETTVPAALKHRDTFHYWPTAKVVIETNAIPRIETTDRAFLKRFYPLEFGVELAEGRMDLKLREKILLERDAIFTRLVGKAVEWHQEGLNRPLGVRTQIERVVEEHTANDGLDEFLEECFDAGPLETTSCSLAEADTLYRAWAEKRRIRPVSRAYLARRLRLRKHLVVETAAHRKGATGRIRGITPKEKTLAAPAGRDAQYKDD